MAIKNSTKLIAMIVIGLLLLVGFLSTTKTQTASITGGCTDTKYISVDGSSYFSFNDMRSKISDMSSITDAQLQSYGLSETSDGVYACK